MLDQFQNKNSGDTYWTQYQSNQSYASGSTVIMNDTAPTADRWNLAAIEILPATPTSTNPPTVPTNLSATAASSSLVNLTWTASSDTVGVTGYRVDRNGTLVGTSPSNSYADATVAANTTYSYTVSAYDSAGNVSAQSTAASVTTPPLPALAPIATITAQPPAETNSTTASITFSASNTTDPSGTISFMCSLGTATLSSCASPATYSGLAVDAQTFSVIATDNADGLSSPAAVARWTIDTTPPVISITNPTTSSTVSGTVPINASVTDSIGVTSVQFGVDGANVGAPVTTGPYSYSWNTTSVGNGTHTLTAIAIDPAGNTAVATTTVVVSNAASASPITIDADVSTHLGTNATSLTSPSFSTTQANELLVAYLGSDGPNSGKSQTFSTVTGAGLTWTMRERANAQDGDAEIWQAVATTALKNVTVTATRGTGGYQGSMDIVSYIGASTTVNGAVATQSAASGAPSISVTTTANDSWVWVVGNDWDNSLARTIGPSQTLLDQYLDSSSGDTYWTQYQNGQAQASGTVVVTNDTAPTGDSWNLAAIEILPSGASNTSPTMPTMPPTVPTNLSATAVNANLVELSWTASTDSGGVAGYDVYRNGTLIGTSPSPTYADTTVAGGTAYSYAVSAYDAAGNVSGQSTAATATTPSGTTTIFSDNFSGTALDSAWTIIDRHGEYDQGETECNVPGAVSVADNILSITTTAQSATCGDFNLDGSVRHAPTVWPYTTGDVQWTNFNFTYGTVTYRAKFPAKSTSTWPAIWFLGSGCQATNIVTADTGYATCPQIEAPGSGYEEIDATECYQNEWCQLALAQPSTFPVCQYPVDTNWHTYTLTWTATSISMSMDGQPTGCSFSSANGYVIPNTPMFMIIQTQTGGSGLTPVNSQLPAVLQVSDVTVTQP